VIAVERQVSNLTALVWRGHVTVLSDNVCFVLDQHTGVNCIVLAH